MTTITRENAEIKSFITGFLSDPAHDNQSTDSLLANVFRIAQASLEAEPIGEVSEKRHGLVMDGTVDLGGKSTYRVIKGEKAMKLLPLGTKFYTAPPAPVIQADVAQAIENLKQKLVECNRYNYCADAVKGVEDACHAAMLQGIQPVSQTYNLPELIEGMEVSIDVSTCDADLGNRYFGTVTEALELDTAKNGYILLVQDAEPNFDVNGNSPGTPDSWVMVPKELTPEMMRAVQIRSELGGYATSNLSGAYNMFSEFWNVAVSAAPKVDDL
ncbi:prophage protein [Escherichia coli]|nr:prophage protein [Escherichia coli]